MAACIHSGGAPGQAAWHSRHSSRWGTGRGPRGRRCRVEGTQQVRRVTLHDVHASHGAAVEATPRRAVDGHARWHDGRPLHGQSRGAGSAGRRPGGTVMAWVWCTNGSRTAEGCGTADGSDRGPLKAAALGTGTSETSWVNPTVCGVVRCTPQHRFGAALPARNAQREAPCGI